MPNIIIMGENIGSAQLLLRYKVVTFGLLIVRWEKVQRYLSHYKWMGKLTHNDTFCDNVLNN